MLLCATNSEQVSNHFAANVYFLTRGEGGRSKPVTSKYMQQLFSKTWNILCRVDLDSNTKMLMPGEFGNVYLTLLRKMVMTKGQPFTIRENNVTVATGIVTETLPTVNIATKLANVNLSY